MYFVAAACSDAGIKKTVNQDSVCIMQGEYAMHNSIFNKNKKGHVIMAMVCDGMGGEKEGEIASKAGVDLFKKWFGSSLPKILKNNRHNSQIIRVLREELSRLTKDLNKDMCLYGQRKGIRIGTTLSLMIILDNGGYVITHVGDSRIYLIKNRLIKQLSYDHSVVAEEVRKGMLTKDQALKDSRRNILTQCVGISDDTKPYIKTGKIKNGARILICSDGFCHEISEAMIAEKTARRYDDKEMIKKDLRGLIEICKSGGEKDNITSLLISCNKRRNKWKS